MVDCVAGDWRLPPLPPRSDGASTLLTARALARGGYMLGRSRRPTQLEAGPQLFRGGRRGPISPLLGDHGRLPSGCADRWSIPTRRGEPLGRPSTRVWSDRGSRAGHGANDTDNRRRCHPISLGQSDVRVRALTFECAAGNPRRIRTCIFGLPDAPPRLSRATNRVNAGGVCRPCRVRTPIRWSSVRS